MLDNALEQGWERVENLTFEGHRATTLTELTSSNLLVGVFKNVELHFDIQLIEHSLVSKFDPFYHVVEILHRLSVEFVKAQFVE
jgi:hypothetical protein